MTKLTSQIDLILPTELAHLIQQHRFAYYRALIPLKEILQEPFIARYINQGKLYGLGTQGDDVLCIDGRGMLVMNVSKDTYETLGLLGTKSKFGKGRYIVEVNIKELTTRQRWCFDTTYVGEVQMTMAYEGAGDLSIDTRVECLSEVSTFEAMCPHILDVFNSDSESQLEYMEWLGMATLGAKRLAPNDNVDPYICQYEVVEGTQRSLTRITWEGFLPPSAARTIMSNSQSLLDTTSWAIITAWGYDSTPISWTRADSKFHEHGQSTYDAGGGENHWSLWMSSDQSLLFEVICGADTFG